LADAVKELGRGFHRSLRIVSSTTLEGGAATFAAVLFAVAALACYIPARIIAAPMARGTGREVQNGVSSLRVFWLVRLDSQRK
jgi:hypothetical protein